MKKGREAGAKWGNGKIVTNYYYYFLCKTKQNKIKQTSKEAKGGSKGEYGGRGNYTLASQNKTYPHLAF